MRTYALFGITLAFAISGCTGARHTESSQNSAVSPLGSCETRVVTLDGVELVVNANADSSLASVRVIEARSLAARNKVLGTVYRAFGTVRGDSDVVARQSKWGLTTLTDPCGRPVGVASPSPASPVR
ncbi:MAG: hypothetical protein WB615_02385 [Candidatus Tumulicola sp.]